MKKIISMLVSLAVVVGTFPMMVAFADDVPAWIDSAAEAYAGGDGTASSPYEIATAEQLAYMAKQYAADKVPGTTYYKLTADINLSGKTWTPIAYKGGDRQEVNFIGTFDGQGHVIKNMTITSVDASASGAKLVGLFGYMENATSEIKNLGLENVNINGSFAKGTIGAVVGRMYNGKITNCYVKNSTITNNDGNWDNFTGSLVGSQRGGKDNVFTNCYASNVVLCTKSKNAAVGGLLGEAGINGTHGATIINCYTTGITAGTGNTATIYPLAKAAYGNIDVLTVTNCYSDVTPVDNKFQHSSAGYFGYDTAKDPLRGVKSTKKQIKDAFASVSNYVVDSTINNGYPALYFEADDAWDGVVATGYAGGIGTDADPYQIATAGQLAYFAQQVNAGETYGKKYFKLTADINLGNQEWTPIGILDADWDPNRPFSGIFDGDGHVVKNLQVSNSKDNVNTFVNSKIKGKNIGLFGYVVNGTIKNVGIENANIAISWAGAGCNTGALVGHSYSGITVDKCYVKDSTIYGDGVISGLIGKYRAGINTFTNCYVIDTVVSSPRGANKMAGFGSSEGDDTSVTFTNCYTANITRNATGDQSALYPFVCTYGARGTQTATNCYTNTMSLDATTTGTYNANYALVGSATAASTKAEIVSGLVTADGAYMIDVTKNGGYPALNWEPKAYVISAITTGDDVKVTLAENEYVVGSTLYVATYDDNNRLIDAVVVSDPVNGQNKTGLSSEGAAYVKAFVWNGDLAPFATSKSVPVQQ